MAGPLVKPGQPGAVEITRPAELGTEVRGADLRPSRSSSVPSSPHGVSSFGMTAPSDIGAAAPPLTPPDAFLPPALFASPALTEVETESPAGVIRHLQEQWTVGIFTLHTTTDYDKLATVSLTTQRRLTAVIESLDRSSDAALINYLSSVVDWLVRVEGYARSDSWALGLRDTNIAVGLARAGLYMNMANAAFSPATDSTGSQSIDQAIATLAYDTQLNKQTIIASVEAVRDRLTSIHTAFRHRNITHIESGAMVERLTKNGTPDQLVVEALRTISDIIRRPDLSDAERETLNHALTENVVTDSRHLHSFLDLLIDVNDRALTIKQLVDILDDVARVRSTYKSKVANVDLVEIRRRSNHSGQHITAGAQAEWRFVRWMAKQGYTLQSIPTDLITFEGRCDFVAISPQGEASLWEVKMVGASKSLGEIQTVIRRAAEQLGKTDSALAVPRAGQHPRRHVAIVASRNLIGTLNQPEAIQSLADTAVDAGIDDLTFIPLENGANTSFDEELALAILNKQLYQHYYKMTALKAQLPNSWPSEGHNILAQIQKITTSLPAWAQTYISELEATIPPAAGVAGTDIIPRIKVIVEWLKRVKQTEKALKSLRHYYLLRGELAIGTFTMNSAIHDLQGRLDQFETFVASAELSPEAVQHNADAMANTIRTTLKAAVPNRESGDIAAILAGREIDSTIINDPELLGAAILEQADHIAGTLATLQRSLPSDLTIPFLDVVSDGIQHVSRHTQVMIDYLTSLDPTTKTYQTTRDQLQQGLAELYELEDTLSALSMLVSQMDTLDLSDMEKTKILGNLHEKSKAHLDAQLKREKGKLDNRKPINRERKQRQQEVEQLFARELDITFPYTTRAKPEKSTGQKFNKQTIDGVRSLLTRIMAAMDPARTNNIDEARRIMLAIETHLPMQGLLNPTKINELVKLVTDYLMIGGSLKDIQESHVDPYQTPSIPDIETIWILGARQVA